MDKNPSSQLESRGRPMTQQPNSSRPQSAAVVTRSKSKGAVTIDPKPTTAAESPMKRPPQKGSSPALKSSFRPQSAVQSPESFRSNTSLDDGKTEGGDTSLNQTQRPLISGLLLQGEVPEKESNDGLASTDLGEAKLGKEGEGEEEEEEGEEAEPAPVTVTLGAGQERFVMFTNEKELRDQFGLKSKALNHTGIIVQIKGKISGESMENVKAVIATSSTVKDLRFEDVVFTKSAGFSLCTLMATINKLETLKLKGVRFEDNTQQKRLLESISINNRIRSLSLQEMKYYDQNLSEAFQTLVTKTRLLRELDLSYCEFHHPKIFVILMTSLQNSKVFTLKFKNVHISKIEGKVMHLFIYEAKTLQTLDISHAFGSSENFFFFHVFDNRCQIKNLTMDELEPDMTPHMAKLGAAFGLNTKLQSLSMRGIQHVLPKAMIEFWQNIKPNRHLKAINMQGNKINNNVAGVIAEFLQVDGIALEDLNLSKNFISEDGLSNLAIALSSNKSLKKLNLSKNKIKDKNLNSLAYSLNINNTLEDLNLMGNEIDNEGITMLSEFLPNNTMLKSLDISKNEFTSQGLLHFATKLKDNSGIVFLNLHKKKETDFEDSLGLTEIAEALKDNAYIQVLDLQGHKLSNRIVRESFLPAIKNNIFIQKIILGKKKDDASPFEAELKDNITIENEIIGCLVKEHIRKTFALELTNKKPDILRPALKLIRCQCIEETDFTNMQLSDDEMKQISEFMRMTPSPPLKKLVLSWNTYITDHGMIELCEALRKNTQLQWLSVMGCSNITDVTLETLYDLVRDINMVLFRVDIDETESRFNRQLIAKIKAEAALNKAIQKFLKPYDRTAQAGVRHIGFEEDADLALHFESVLKVWRIKRANYVEIFDKNLEDEHITQFARLMQTHLQDMQHISLRRNKIGNKGAEALAEFIMLNTSHLTYLEISRNKIGDEGGAKILEAMKKNTMIVTLLIDFGNEIKDSIAHKLELEVQANQHIFTQIQGGLAPGSDMYACIRLQDKGREFLRCALKSVMELSIINLDLQDNLLTYNEAKKIAKVVSANTQLKVLNLSKNLLDGRSAEVLAKALLDNSNLLELNLDSNRIGDQGISRIVLPLAKQELRAKMEVVQENTKIRLMKLSVGNNAHSLEALKHIYALLFANREIIVEINDPTPNAKLAAMASKNQIMPSMNQSSPSKNPAKVKQMIELRQKNMMGLGRFAKLFGLQNPPSPAKAADKAIMKDLLDSSVVKPVVAKKNKKGVVIVEEPEKKQTDILIPMAVENEELPEELPQLTTKNSTFNVGKFFFGTQTDSESTFFVKRFINSMKENEADARLFKCNENILSNVESVSQRYVTIGLYVSVFFFYFTALIIPMTEGNSCIHGHQTSVFYYYGIYMIASGSMELVLIVYLQKMVADMYALKVNKFHLWKIVGGELARMDFFTDVLFMMQMYSCELYILLAPGIFFLFLSVLYQIYMLFKLLRRDETQLLENIERNCKLGYITDHMGIAIILDTFSLSNFESVGRNTVTVPKIMACIKSFVEDAPLFVIQVIFILFYSKEGSNLNSVIVSILLGLYSFAMSIRQALQAKASNVDMKRVNDKLEERVRERQQIFLDTCHQEQEELKEGFRKELEEKKEKEQQFKVVAEPPSFEPKLKKTFEGRSFLMNGNPVFANRIGLGAQNAKQSKPGSSLLKHYDNDPGVITLIGSANSAIRSQANLKDLKHQSTRGKETTILMAMGKGRSLFAPRRPSSSSSPSPLR